MDCEHMYYDEKDGDFYPKLLCNVTKNRCLYSRRCDLVHKFIPIENGIWEDCYIMIEEQIKNIPKDANYVRTYKKNKKGKLYLYVVIDDKIEKILTDFEEIKQNYVYIKEGSEGYIVSLTPFAEEVKVKEVAEEVKEEPIENKTYKKQSPKSKRYESKRN